MRTNIASLIGGDAATVNNDSENHEADTSDDFHDTEDELDLV